MWKHALRFLTPFLILVAASACNESKFRGSNGAKKEIVPDQCQDKSQLIGVDVAFVIDNSGSNVQTDCQNPKADGRHSTGAMQYQCQSATNREKAVLATYDALSEIDDGQDMTNSSFGVVSFPGRQDIEDSAELQTQSFIKIQDQDRNELESSLTFTRSPLGMTPYGAGLTEARNLFSTATDSKRKRLVVLVSDGEPTDKQPTSVIEMVKADFADQSIPVFTVIVTGDQDISKRLAEHEQFLVNRRDYDDEVIDILVGRNGQTSLVDQISTKKLKVNDAEELEKTFKEIIKENVSCE